MIPKAKVAVFLHRDNDVFFPNPENLTPVSIQLGLFPLGISQCKNKIEYKADVIDLNLDLRNELSETTELC